MGPSVGGNSGRFDDEVALNLTAMIDVCFLLLTFLLVGTHFRQPQGQLDSDLPNTSKGIEDNTKDEFGQIMVMMGAPKEKDAMPVMTVEWTAGGQGPVKIADKPTLYKELERYSRDQRLRDNVPVVLSPDSEVKFQWIVDALDASSRLGFKKIQFRWPPDKKDAAAKTGT